jgi:hypothetical protein
VETMPSLAPSTAARNQPMRCVLCFSVCLTAVHPRPYHPDGYVYRSRHPQGVDRHHASSARSGTACGPMKSAGHPIRRTADRTRRAIRNRQSPAQGPDAAGTPRRKTVDRHSSNRARREAPSGRSHIVDAPRCLARHGHEDYFAASRSLASLITSSATFLGHGM